MARGTVNKVIILGRLGQDPDVRTTASGTMIVNLNVATTELGPKEPNMNQRQDVTEWHRIVLFGRTAEVASQYLSKGSQVYIEGRLQTRKWQDQNGQDRYSTEIVGNELQFIGGKSDGGQAGNQPQDYRCHQGSNQQNPTTQQGFNQANAPAAPQPQGFDDFSDDIPFN